MANNSIRGITLEIGGDTTKLSKALSQVNKDLRSTQTDLNAINKALKLDPTNVNLLRDKHELLGKAIQETNSKLSTLKEAYRQGLSNPDIGEDEMRALHREIDLTESSLNSLTSEYENFGEAADGAVDGAIQDTATLAKNLEEAGDKIKSVGDKISSAGSTLTKTVTMPLVGAGTASVKTAADFESAMSQVQATMGITSDSMSEVDGQTVNTMKALAAFAQQMGASTAWSAKDAAGALNYLALAGYDTQQMFDVLPTVLNLASAGGMDLAKASDMVTDAMSALNLTTEDADKMVDIMAKTASSSNTSVEQLGEAILKIGGTAANMKGGVGELSTALGVLANNSIKGAEGGTALRNIMLSLENAKSTEAAAAFEELGVHAYDSEGNLKSLNEILSDLRVGMEGMTQQEKDFNLSKIFNKNDLAAVNALLKSSGDEWTSLEDKINNSAGAAQQMADTQLDNLNGQLTLLKSALESAAISIGNSLMPTIKELTGFVQGLVDKFNALSPEQQQAIVKFAAMAAAIGPLVLITGKLISGFGSVISTIGRVSTFLGGLGGAATTAGEAVSTVSEVGTAAGTASQGLNAAGSAMGVLSQNALGFVALGGGIALAAGGMWILAKAAVVIAEGGWGAAAALLELVAAIAALAAVFAALGGPLTAGAVGIGVFGAAVLGIGAAIGIASAGLALLMEQLPLVAEYGQPAADAFVSLGAGILSMSTECLTATPGLLAIDTALIGLAASTVAADLGWIGFAATMGIAAAAVGVLDLAMGAFALTMSSIQEDATKAGEAIGFIQENVDVIKSGVEGLKDIVENGLDGIVDFFKDTSTEPVDAWAQSFSALYDSTSGTLINVTKLVLKSLAYIKRAFANTQLSFNKNIVLPHFSLDGAFDLQAGTVPAVNVNWYKTGGIFDTPSVIGVGEDTPEAVTPIDKLQAMIDSSTAKANNAILNTMQEMLQVMQMYLPQNRQVVLDSGVLVGEIAPAMDNELGVRANRRSRQA